MCIPLQVRYGYLRAHQPGLASQPTRENRSASEPVNNRLGPLGRMSLCNRVAEAEQPNYVEAR